MTINQLLELRVLLKASLDILEAYISVIDAIEQIYLCILSKERIVLFEQKRGCHERHHACDPKR
jgi:hypothetical protein